MSTWILDPTLTVEDCHKVFRKPSLRSYATGPTHDASFQGAGGEPVADYVIVGGGTAGLALASRLAESDPNISVMVLEAGIRRDDPVIDVPGLYGRAVQDVRYDWSYQTVPQNELGGRQVKSSAGRILGGSSAINYLVLMRASAPEYDAWSYFGKGWDWNGLLPYFKKKEQYTAPKWGTDQIFPGVSKADDDLARQKQDQFYGKNGPIHSNNNDMYSDLEKPSITTLNNLHIKTNRLQGYGDSTGMFNINTAVDRSNGKRTYAANTYGDPEKKRPNLTIITCTYVTRILFSDTLVNGNRVATGVELMIIPPPVENVAAPPAMPPVLFTVKANKEVIISAGSYNTPRLLELSGVGDPKILKGVGITPIIELPGVGANLQEHPFIISDFVVKDTVFTFDRLRTDPAFQEQQMKQYMTDGTGAYATTVAAYGFIKLDTFLSAAEIAELMAELKTEMDAVTDPFHKKQLESQLEYLKNPNVGDVELIMVPKAFATAKPEDKGYVSLCGCIPHTVSRGTVHIKSKNPTDPPDIDPKYMTSAFDLKVMVKLTQFMRKITETQPLADLVVNPSTPPASVKTYAEFEQFVRQNLSTVQHPVGTASMAPRNMNGVVNENLIVHGTTNVRVADMSIVPIHIATHTCETAYAIGEKAFSIISSPN